MHRFAVALAALLASTVMASAQDALETYTARLGVDDHYNSNGQPLDNPAAIIRQDRANVHAFGIRDPEDESDRFFSSKANRARLEALLNAGRMDRYTANAIVRGTPLITVEVYEDYIVVTAAEE